VSHTDVGNLCDVAPSRFKRFDRDEYFTIDAGWIIPALCCAVQVEGPIFEPCAGRGHMVRELRALGFVVRGADLYAYADTLVPDIKSGADVFDLKSLVGYRFIVTNLPYREQAAILAHLLPIAARDGVNVAVLARSDGVRPRLAARLCMRTRGSLVKYGLRSALSGFALRLRRRATGSVGSSGRRSRARLPKIPFCASLAMCRKDAEGDGWVTHLRRHVPRRSRPPGRQRPSTLSSHAAISLRLQNWDEDRSKDVCREPSSHLHSRRRAGSR
jgi:hypothetical protein